MLIACEADSAYKERALALIMQTYIVGLLNKPLAVDGKN